jgi:hypothetical protein
MRRNVVPPELKRGPFTSRTAARVGVSKNVLRGKDWRRLFREVWISVDIETTRSMWLQAARLVLPVDAVLFGLSAVDAHGIDARATHDLVVYAAFADKAPRARPGLQVRRMAFAADEVTVLGNWLVTTATRTAFDCARLLPLVEAVVVVDAMVHGGLITLDGLEAVAAGHGGTRWVRRVKKVLSLAASGAESPMETRLRLVLELAGLPRPVLQHVIRSASGGFIARVDMAYVDAKLVVEYDGSWHWQQRRRDDRRRDTLRALGWTVLVFSAEDVYDHPEDVVAAVGSALKHAA